MLHPLKVVGFLGVVFPCIDILLTVSIHTLIAPSVAAYALPREYVRRASQQRESRETYLEGLPSRYNDRLVHLHDLYTDGFTELFVKRRKGETEDDLEEVPTTSSQHRAAWREEERHAEHPMCTDVGFRGLHPEEGGEEATCWSRCGRVCEGAMYLAEDALPEWRLVAVASRTKPCRTIAKKSNVQVLCKAIKKPTHYDITHAVRQETTFDNEMTELQQQIAQRQQILGMPRVDGSPSGLPEIQEFEAEAGYRRGAGSFPHWAVYIIVAACVALILMLIGCCCFFCRRL